jgi:Polymerase beta, Nucleotidyltransferase
MNYEEILKRAGLKDSDVVNCYLYGSRVYGNYRKDSDYDFIVIVKNKTVDQFSDNLININFFTPEGHQHRLNEHEISALECFFLHQNIFGKTVEIIHLNLI